MTHVLAISTCPDIQTAEQIGSELLRRRLIACINILPGALSLYEWKGKIEREQECLLFMKTRADAYEQLETAVQELHPYELPEVIAVSIEHGLSDYLGWIDQQVDKKQ